MSSGGERDEKLWVEEAQHDILRRVYPIERVLLRERSPFQLVEVVESTGFGRMLLLDSVVQVAERDEFVYHEMIAHVPLFVHPNPRSVLVIGGGDGGSVREVLRHGGVERCRLVEIDDVVIQACREHIPQTAASLDDPRCEVSVTDGARFVEGTNERFDVVLVDSSDPVGAAAPLFGADFYRAVHQVLDDDGIVVSQAGSPFYDEPLQRSLTSALSTVFPRVEIYNYSNLTYPGGLWSFSYASKNGRCPVEGFCEDRYAAAALALDYYDARVHRAAFALPPFQQRALALKP